MEHISALDSSYFAIPPLAVQCTLAFLKPPPASLVLDASGGGVARIAGMTLRDLVWGRSDVSMRVLAIERDRERDRGGESSGSSSGRGGSGASKGQTSGQGQGQGVFHVALYLGDEEESVNERLAAEGLARVSQRGSRAVKRNQHHVSRGRGRDKDKRSAAATANTGNGTELAPAAAKLLSALQAAQKQAHREHLNMFRYGDPGDESDGERDRDRERDRGATAKGR